MVEIWLGQPQCFVRQPDIEGRCQHPEKRTRQYERASMNPG